MTTPSYPAALARLQAAFLAQVLPKVLSHGRVYFRHLKSAERKEEYIAEMVALAWRWHLRLAERGQDAAQFPTAIATFAARAVRSGRRLAGMDRADVLSPQARQRHGFAVGTLADCSSLNGSVWDEALVDNTQSPVVAQVCFRCDFPNWRASRTARDQRVLDDLMVGERTSDVAGKHGLSPGRVSQLRRELHDDWEFFCAGPPQVV